MERIIKIVDTGTERYTLNPQQIVLGRMYDNNSEKITINRPNAEKDSVCTMIITDVSGKVIDCVVITDKTYTITNTISAHQFVKIGFSFSRPDGYVKGTEIALGKFLPAPKPIAVEPIYAKESEVIAGKKFKTNGDMLKSGTMETYSGETTITKNGTVAVGGKFVTNDLTVNITTGDKLQLKCDTMKTLKYLFYNHSDFDTEIYNVLNGLDTSKVTDMSNMFYGCKALTTIPQLDTRNVADMSSMFFGCAALTAIPQLDTSNATNMASMFAACVALTAIPSLDTSNVINMSNMFGSCNSLTSIPQLDTSNVINMSNMFSGCSALTSIPLLDMNKVIGSYSTSSMFNKCENLTNLTLLNIHQHIDVKESPLLTTDSLVNTMKECIKQTSTRTLTLHATSKANIANVYVKFTDGSTTIDVGQKGNVVVCESTDEGAMLITDYMALKSWSVA